MDKTYHRYFVSFYAQICGNTSIGNTIFDFPDEVDWCERIKEMQEFICKRFGCSEAAVINLIPLDEPEQPEKPKAEWRQAIKVLHDFCEKHPRCVECPAQNWCESNGFYGRETFLPYQWEMPSEEE